MGLGKDKIIESAIIEAIKTYDKLPTWAEICCEIYQMGFEEHWDPTLIVRIHDMEYHSVINKSECKIYEAALGDSGNRKVWYLAKSRKKGLCCKK